ncbi:hypothetical protein [Evansella cellulosilytica]|uniref:Uncharacterized protein n=1 Tax=Evansella cellulosilytica (strain ATCC 21833 / DSM 2522 / FERM P-1141 / JCM 9156 / N-4) TaxID=649639 RepID=E6U230_EVAC2|nr:hypothetical protein [Evansella cellulosilytica]ADU29274.1 hypothetical protein Bcell_1001 [Evansella cellulosilytica DSM 2522]
MSQFNKKDIKRALKETKFSSNPFNAKNSKQVLHIIKNKSGAGRNSFLGTWLKPSVVLLTSSAILFVLVFHYYQTGSFSPSNSNQTDALVVEEDEEREEYRKDDVADETQKIREMIGVETNSEPEEVVYEYGDGMYATESRIDYVREVNVKNFLVDGVDTNNLGYIMEDGYHTLISASLGLVESQLPGQIYPFSRFTYKDAYTEDQVVNLKLQFNELSYIFPAGKFDDEELIQATFLLLSENQEEEYLKDIVKTIKTDFPTIPVTVLFTTKYDYFLKTNAIGYYNNVPVIQYLNGVQYGENNELASHLSNKFNFIFNEEVNGIHDVFDMFYVQGFHNGSGTRASVDSPSTEAKTLLLLIEGNEQLDDDHLNVFAEMVMEEVYDFYGTSDIALSLHIYNINVRDWNGMYDEPYTVVKFPDDDDWMIYEVE